MRTVFVTKFVPMPTNSGGKRRSLAVLRRLRDLGDVTLCCFRESSDDDLEALSEMGVDVRAVPWRPRPAALPAAVLRTRSLSSARFFSRQLGRTVDAALGEGADALVVAYSQLAPYGYRAEVPVTLLDLHNIESSLAASYARSKSGLQALPYRVEAEALRRLERRAIKEYDVVSVVSETDRDRLPGVPRRTVVAPNGWESGEAPAPSRHKTVAFVALMGWAPNADAAVWLARQVWPRVLAHEPGAELLLVCRQPSPAVQALSAPAIEVTGTVPDVGPYLARARVAVAPLLAGGGSRLKILEALDAARPVVATSKGAEGLEDLIGSGVVVADTAEAFAGALVEFLRDPELADKVGRAGRAAVQERHSWDAALQPMVDRLLEQR